MADPIANDASSIASRLKEIRRESVPSEYSTATGAELDLLAEQQGLTRKAHEGDYELRTRLIDFVVAKW